MDRTDPIERRRCGPLLVAVSLKMYLDVATTARWCRRVAVIAAQHPAVRSGAAEVLVFPAAPALGVARAELGGAVALGAQDLFAEDRGPFTGGVSGADLHEIGCRYVEVGHAERRRFFREDDTDFTLKTRAAWRTGLTPVLCVGETEPGDVAEAAGECLDQLASALAAGPGPDSPVRDLVVAYEPTWAIGAREPAPVDRVLAVVSAVQEGLAASTVGLGTSRVIYGGSARAGLLTELGDGVDGLFLGRFAHDPEVVGEVLDECLEPRRPEGRCP